MYSIRIVTSNKTITLSDNDKGKISLKIDSGTVDEYLIPKSILQQLTVNDPNFNLLESLDKISNFKT